ncbi:MAG: MFS transporter [Nostocoides sp.]
MWRQPRTVWSVAFACVIAFMGIGLVDPILVSIAQDLNASPSQVSLLFTSYMAVMGVAMLLTGWVSSRIGPKRTLLLGLAIIIIGAGLAGMQDSITGIVGFRAVWGLGNALFVATALATIVSAASGSVAQAIILYEAALGVGIAAGPLLGGTLGAHSWRWPFFGVSMLMFIALIATWVTLPKTPADGHPTSIFAPFRAMRYPGLLTASIAALLYNMGFFTLLAFTPFPLGFDAHGVGMVFFGWGLLLAFFSVVVAPRVQAQLGTVNGILLAMGGFALILAMMGIWTAHTAALVTGVVLAGAVLGIINTLMTETVMKVAPVERSVASAAYSFVRFSGGAVAPWAASKLGEHSMHLPFLAGSAAVLLGLLAILTGRRFLVAVDEGPEHGVEPVGSLEEAEAVTFGDA